MSWFSKKINKKSISDSKDLLKISKKLDIMDTKINSMNDKIDKILQTNNKNK